MKEEIKVLAQEIYDYYSADELAVIIEAFEKFINASEENKFKRKDVEYFIDLIS